MAPVLLVAAGALAGGVTARIVGPGRATTVVSSPRPSPAVTESAPVVAGARIDVADLVSSALPGIVSIEVVTDAGTQAGTGFLISGDGDIATNAHVVAGANKVTVTLADGSDKSARVVGIDRTDDLAVIKVDGHDLPALPLGSSAGLKVGQPVVAIGNALALTGGPTATEGIVSALDRTIETSDGEHLRHLVQTDAAINPGNSGGPLLALDGTVVGINSAGSSDAQNIGFAISIDGARSIIEQLQNGETVTKAYLGVSTQLVDGTVASQNGLSVDHGLLIVDVAGDSGAAAADLRPGDVIVSIDGKDATSEDVLRDSMAAAGPGAELKLAIRRGTQHLDVTATLSSHTA